MQSSKRDCKTWNNCDGKGTLGCLISLVLLAAVAFVAIQAGPPYFAYKSFQGDINTEVSRAGAHFYGDDALVQNILDVAKKNSIRIKKENVKIDRFAGQVQVIVDYDVPVDFYFVQHTFNFEIRASSYIGTL